MGFADVSSFDEDDEVKIDTALDDAALLGAEGVVGVGGKLSLGTALLSIFVLELEREEAGLRAPVDGLRTEETAAS